MSKIDINKIQINVGNTVNSYRLDCTYANYLHDSLLLANFIDSNGKSSYCIYYINESGNSYPVTNNYISEVIENNTLSFNETPQRSTLSINNVNTGIYNNNSRDVAISQLQDNVEYLYNTLSDLLDIFSDSSMRTTLGISNPNSIGSQKLDDAARTMSYIQVTNKMTLFSPVQSYSTSYSGTVKDGRN